LTEQASVQAPARERLSTFALLALIGAASILPYVLALRLNNLLLNIVPFEWLFFAAAAGRYQAEKACFGLTAGRAIL